MDKMKIKLAIITSSPGNVTSGGQISVRLLSKTLLKEGINHTVFTCENDNDYEWGSNNVIKHKLKKFQKFAQSVSIAELIAKKLFDLEQKGINIFHIYNMGAMGGCGLYKLLGGKSKVVATLNSYYGFCPIATYICNGKRKCNLVNRYKCLTYQKQKVFYNLFSFVYALIYPISVKLMKLLDGYIAVSEAVKKIYVDNGYDRNKINVIPNMYEVNNDEQIDTKYNNEIDIFKILYVGLLAKNKGVHILARAFQKMIDHRPNALLTLVGDGPLLNELESLVIDTKLEDKIVLPGAIMHSKIYSYYKNAHVFVLPGLWSDPFPRTLLEALSGGLPCVVSSIGSPPEIVGNAGLIFPLGDEYALSNLLIRLYDEPDLRLRLSSHCKERLKCFSQDKVIIQIINYYNRILEI
jgi:glycosyltransferase involved in cell wall biosynthesis